MTTTYELEVSFFGYIRTRRFLVANLKEAVEDIEACIQDGSVSEVSLTVRKTR